MIFSATCCSSPSSFTTSARNTSAIPPTPSRERTWYLPYRREGISMESASGSTVEAPARRGRGAHPRGFHPRAACAPRDDTPGGRAGGAPAPGEGGILPRPGSGTMNCTKCGQALTGGSVFCSRCGTPTGMGAALGEVVEPTLVPVKGSEVLDGKWKLERKIGEGGMGAVYLAHDLQLDRKVAIKILASSLAHDAELVARFEREARFTASLEHPNIVPIYAVGRFKARPFMVMKYLEGQPLSAILRAQNVMPLDQVLALTRQVCGGLEFIHAKGYVHRDIKAGNIFVSPAGLATILDFGILRP